MNQFPITLGALYSDRITGFQGRAIGHVTYLTGCHQTLLAPQVTKEGALRDSAWFDDQRLERFDDDDVLTLDNGETPGACEPAPLR